MFSMMKFLLILFAFTSTTCINPFAPGWDEETDKSICPNLNEIDGVLCNFRNAYLFKDTTIYGTLISPNFNFIYRDYDRGVDVLWGRDDEMRTTYGLFQSATALSLIWNNEVSSSGDSVRQTIVRSFNLTITFNPGDIVRIDGYANLTFERESFLSPWKIVRWRDESNF